MSVVRLSVRTSGRGTRSASLGVPKEIALQLHEAGIEAFSIELTEEGILFRPLASGAPTVAKPTWLVPVSGNGRRNGRRS